MKCLATLIHSYSNAFEAFLFLNSKTTLCKCALKFSNKILKFSPKPSPYYEKYTREINFELPFSVQPPLNVHQLVDKKKKEFPSIRQ